MTKFRQPKKRSLSFDALERRLTLSSGAAAVAPHAHVLVMSRGLSRIPINLHGHISFNGATQMTSDLAGRVGNNRFTGHGSVTVSGTAVVNGDVYLSNNRGSLHLKLDSGSFTQVGRRQRQAVPFTVVEATGKYAAFNGATGLGTSWSVPANTNQTSIFAGYVNNLSA
jgi:hypothetical protein